MYFMHKWGINSWKLYLQFVSFGPQQPIDRSNTILRKNNHHLVHSTLKKNHTVFFIKVIFYYYKSLKWFKENFYQGSKHCVSWDAFLSIPWVFLLWWPTSSRWKMSLSSLTFVTQYVLICIWNFTFFSIYMARRGVRG